MKLIDLSSEQFEKELSQQGVLLLDVRTREEYEEKHLSNALLIPVDELPQRLNELAPYRDHSILIYCKAGVRSFYAGIFLLEQGFDSVSHLQPGILGWIGAGKEVHYG